MEEIEYIDTEQMCQIDTFVNSTQVKKKKTKKKKQNKTIESSECSSLEEIEYIDTEQMCQIDTFVNLKPNKTIESSESSSLEIESSDSSSLEEIEQMCQTDTFVNSKKNKKKTKKPIYDELGNLLLRKDNKLVVANPFMSNNIFITAPFLDIMEDDYYFQQDNYYQLSCFYYQLSCFNNNNYQLSYFNNNNYKYTLVKYRTRNSKYSSNYYDVRLTPTPEGDYIKYYDVFLDLQLKRHYCYPSLEHKRSDSRVYIIKDNKGKLALINYNIFNLLALKLIATSPLKESKTVLFYEEHFYHFPKAIWINIQKFLVGYKSICNLFMIQDYEFLTQNMDLGTFYKLMPKQKRSFSVDDINKLRLFLLEKDPKNFSILDFSILNIAKGAEEESKKDYIYKLQLPWIEKKLKAEEESKKK